MQIIGACRATIRHMLKTNKQANKQKSYFMLHPDGPIDHQSVCSIIVPRLVRVFVSVSLPVSREVAAPDGVMISQFIALLPRSDSRGAEIKELDLEAFLPRLSLLSFFLSLSPLPLL